jgi:outer membrane lipoprotein-sorting protein
VVVLFLWELTMNVFRYLMVGIVVLLLVSCGNNNKSSASKPSSSEHVKSTASVGAQGSSAATPSSDTSSTQGGSSSTDASSGSAGVVVSPDTGSNEPGASPASGDTTQQALKQKAIMQDLLKHMSYYNKTLSADFIQKNLSENDQSVVSGHLELKRPDRFLWVTYVDETKNEIDEQILGNGRLYWKNNPSLEQVIKRKVNLSRLPLVRLLLHDDQSVSEIMQDFTLSELSSDNNSAFILKPKPSAEIDLNNIVVRFKNKKLSQLVLESSLTNQSVFTFSNQKVNLPIDDSHFCYSGKIVPLDPAGDPAPVKSGDCV